MTDKLGINRFGEVFQKKRQNSSMVDVSMVGHQSIWQSVSKQAT
jgi:hypothetical protein